MVLGFLKDKVRKRIENWDGVILLRGGKEILLKTVVQSLSTFSMGVFLLPWGLIKDLERCMNNFWWQTKKNEKKGIHWMEWSKMTPHKSVGGMGFKNLRDFNLSMLGKQGWRLMTNHNSLVSRIYKAPYYPNGNFLSVSLGSNPSYVWRSIWEAKPLLM